MCLRGRRGWVREDRGKGFVCILVLSVCFLPDFEDRKRARQKLPSLIAENGNACTTCAYISPTPGFFAQFYYCQCRWPYGQRCSNTNDGSLERRVVSAYNVYLHILCMIEPGKGMRFSSTQSAGAPSVVHRWTARRASIKMTVRVDILTKAVTSNPQTDGPKFPNQLWDSHPDLIEHTTNVHLIPPLTINTDTRKQTRSTEIQTNPFPLSSLTHPLLPRKHTPHLTSDTPPLSVP